MYRHLITGETYRTGGKSDHGKVFAATNEVCTLPVFRPVIAFDKQEISRCIRKDWMHMRHQYFHMRTAVQLFVAKHPVTKPNLNVIKNSETHLAEEIDRMFKEAIDTVEVIEINN